MADPTLIKETVEAAQAAGPIGAFGLNGKIFVAQLVNFGLVLLVLWRFAYRPIVNMLEARSEKIEKSVKEAEAFQAKVDAEEKALRDKALEPVVLACGGEGYVRWNDYQKAVGVAVFIVPAAEGKECVTGEVILPREIRAARRRSGDRISVRRSYSNGTKDKSFVEYEPTRIVRLGKTPRGWTFKNTGTEPVEQKFEAMR